MNDLIAALEKAEEGSRELDVEIDRRVAPKGWQQSETGAWFNNNQRRPPPYTRSLDAALTLVPRDGSVSTVSLAIWPDYNGEGKDVTDADLTRFHPDEDEVSLGRCSMADAPALAICIAALKARHKSR